MEVYFKDKGLHDMVKNPRKLVKEMGSIRARLLLLRLQTLTAANNPGQLKGFPGHFHELKGDRKGQWACDLDQPYRLIFEPKERMDQTDRTKHYVIVIEIIDYH